MVSIYEKRKIAMNSRELMVGNHVSICGGEIVVVTSVRSNGIVTTTLGDMDERNLEPVPLSSEIIEKCGFCQIRTSWEKPSVFPYRCIVRGPIDGCFHVKAGSCECSLRKYIRNLHELENLYFTCYGEELICE